MERYTDLYSITAPGYAIDGTPDHWPGDLPRALAEFIAAVRWLSRADRRRASLAFYPGGDLTAAPRVFRAAVGGGIVENTSNHP